MDDTTGLVVLDACDYTGSRWRENGLLQPGKLQRGHRPAHAMRAREDGWVHEPSNQALGVAAAAGNLKVLP